VNTIAPSPFSDLPVVRRRPATFFLLALALTAAVTVTDAATGYEFRLGALYLVPIALATWAAGLAAGLAVSVVAALTWVLSFRGSHLYSEQWFFYWEAVLNFGIFLLFAMLFARLRDALDSSDARFVTAMQSLNAAVYATEARGGRILFANRCFLETFPEATIGRDASSLQARFIADHDVQDGDHSREVIDRVSRRWYLHGARDVRWVDGVPARLNILADVTDSRHARDLQRQHEEMLHRTSRAVALAEMASSLGHELNQPLGAIGSYLEACDRLLGGPPENLAELREVIGKCRAQASRSGTILRRMREFVARREPVRRETDLVETVAAVLRLVDSEARDIGVRIETDIDAASKPAPFDRVLLEQALVNLLRNAMEALRNAAPERRRVWVRARALANSEVQLSVDDGGAGLEPEVAGRLFVSFVTTKPGGTGLGLSICRSIIEAHGGRIWHEPLADGGCSFRFTLPGSAR